MFSFSFLRRQLRLHDREESEGEKRRKKMQWSCLPKIEEYGPRPSPLCTSDWARGLLGVLVRQIITSPVAENIFLSF